MGIFSSLFETPSVVGKITSAIIDTGDALILTDEEKIQYSQESMKIKMDWMRLYEPFKIAQRYLAIIISIPYMIMGSTVFFAKILGFETYGAENLLDGNIGLAFVLIVGFYFASGAGEGLISKWKGK